MSAVGALTSPMLAALAGVRHGFFTRHGGVSKGLYASLNVGRGSRDDPAHVAENRRRAAAAFEVSPERLYTAYQVHSAIALRADQAWGDKAAGEARPQGDAVASGTAGLMCGALAADCAPVLLADAGARVVAAVHAGWRGALGGVVQSAVSLMVEMGGRLDEIVAVVGPCIGPASYEIGLDFLAAFQSEAPGAERFFRSGAGPDKRLFDLPGFVLHRLAQAGVSRAEWIGRDTCGEPDDFFSNRKAHHRGEPDYGRLLSAIMLV